MCSSLQPFILLVLTRLQSLKHTLVSFSGVYVCKCVQVPILPATAFAAAMLLGGADTGLGRSPPSINLVASSAALSSQSAQVALGNPNFVVLYYNYMVVLDLCVLSQISVLFDAMMLCELCIDV